MEALKAKQRRYAELTREREQTSLTLLNIGLIWLRLWIDEAIRRDEEFDSGSARAYPADEVLARSHEI